MLSKISKYRNEIMGAAILWIIFYHSRFCVTAFPTVIQFVKSVGFGGVDIFLFVSGFGLFFSLFKADDTVSFYKRRAKRIFPAYLPVLTIWLLFEIPSISVKGLPAAAWNNITGFSFWLRRAPEFNWYILALPAFYVIAPSFFRILKRWDNKGEIVLLALTMVFDICFLNQYVMIAISRFTIFALGMIAGKHYLEGREIDRETEVAIYVLGSLGWVFLYIFKVTVPKLMWNYGLYWYPFVFIAPMIIGLLCRLFDLLERIKIGKWIDLAFAGMGKCSLEIYLIHVKVFEIVKITSNWAWAALTIAMLALGKLYHEVIAAVMKRGNPFLRKADESKQTKEIEPDKPHRMVYIDFMRIVACFLVIVNHTEESLFRDRGPSLTWFAGLIYFFICKIAVPLFLIIMGTLLLQKEDTPQKAKMRLLRGAAVLAVTSAVYYVYKGAKVGESLGMFDFVRKVLQKHITTALWYMYLYLGILCLLPILQKLVKAIDKKEIQWLLFLSLGVLGTAPLVHIFIPAFGLSGNFMGVLISAYIGMVLWGYYIERYVTLDRVKFWLAALSFVLLIIFQVIATYYLYQKDPSKYLYLDNRTFITITGSAASFYIMVKYLFSKFTLGPKMSQAITYLGGLTFGMYLLSDLIIDLTKPIHAMLQTHVHVIIAVILWELLIFVICAILTAALKQISGLKKWI